MILNRNAILIAAVIGLAAGSLGSAASYGGGKGKSKETFYGAPRRADKGVPGAAIFDRPLVLQIGIEIAPAELAALRKENRKHVRATVREGSNVWKEVGIHLKGAAGSFRGIDDKPALTLGFSKFTPDQKFYGLRKIHLNNSVQDASYLTEYLCGELFRKAGVPAARVSYATVTLNGRSRGLYVLKEGFAKEMLSLYFDKTGGNLYDGGFLREVTDQLERDMGSDDVTDWSDLKALAKAAQEPDATKRFEQLSKVLDVDRFIAYAALEVMTWDWDGYVMNRNNYRVYHDLDSSRMVFLPHGMDQMFWEAEGPIMANMQGLVAQGLIKTPQGRALYRERFGEIFTNVFQLEALTNRVAELAAVIRPALTNLHGARAGRDYDGQVKRIHDLIVQRHASLARQINTPEPKPLAFDGNNEVKLAGWRKKTDAGEPLQEESKLGEKRVLRISSRNAPCVASWRTRVLLAPGRYQFQAAAKSKGVVPQGNDPGTGAGLRISGEKRQNKLTGDADWTQLQFDIEVQGVEREVELVCELRANRGEVWFDADSLRLRRVAR